MSGRWSGMVALVLVGALAPAPGRAAEGKVEITPFAGYRVGGDIPDIEGASHASVAEGTSYGLMLDFKVKEGGFIEVRYSVQRTELDVINSLLGPGQVKVTDLDVEHYFFGGTYEWETGTMALPFVSADVGGVRFDTHWFNGETSFAFALGGGVKLPLAKHFQMRFDGRWVSTLINGNTSLYCNSAGFCIVAADGTYFGQFEITAGLTAKF